MKKAIRLISGTALTIFLSITLAACGGGGDDAAPADSISYSGVTTQAVINNTNAKALSIDAYEGGNSGASLGGGGMLAAQTGPSAVASPAPPLRALAQALRGALAKLPLETTPVVTVAAVVPVSPPETMPGDCKGSATISMGFDEAANLYVGSVSFDRYQDFDANGTCDEATGTTLSGQMTFTMSVDPNESITTTITALKATTGTESFTTSGSMIMTQVDIDTFRVILNMVLRDDATGKTHKIENYQIDIDDFGTYVSETLTGRFYNPDYGFVELTTLNPLQVYNDSDWPSSGALHYAGANGSSLTLTFNPLGATGTGTDGSGNIDFTYTR
jgi:hypothetical protein